MPASIHLDDLDAEQRKQLGIRKPRAFAFNKEELRGRALKTPALVTPSMFAGVGAPRSALRPRGIFIAGSRSAYTRRSECRVLVRPTKKV
jgi:hypothetical protein